MLIDGLLNTQEPIAMNFDSIPRFPYSFKKIYFKMLLTICQPYNLSLNAQIQLNSQRRRQNNWHFADEILLKFIVGCSFDSKPSTSWQNEAFCHYLNCKMTQFTDAPLGHGGLIHWCHVMHKYIGKRSQHWFRSWHFTFFLPPSISKPAMARS